MEWVLLTIFFVGMKSTNISYFFFSSRRRHTRLQGDWSSDVCSSDLQRGQVEGVTGSWSSMKAERPNWLRDRQVRVLVQIGRKRHRDLPDVPLIMDYIRR